MKQKNGLAATNAIDGTTLNVQDSQGCPKSQNYLSATYAKTSNSMALYFVT